MLKLADGIISTSDSLRPLLASDTHPYVSLSNHRNIIGTVANRKRDPVTLVFSQANNLCFLGWRYTTAYYRLSVNAKFEKQTLTLIVFHCPYQRWSIYNHRKMSSILSLLKHFIQVLNASELHFDINIVLKFVYLVLKLPLEFLLGF